MIGFGGVIVVCIVLGHVLRCDESLWWSRFGMCVWGVLPMGMHGSGGVVVGEVRCKILVLLEAGITLGLTVSFSVPDGVLSLVVSLSGIGMKVGFGRLRLWLYVFWC